MDLVNRLIREAKASPRSVKIRPQDVGPLAAHMRLLMFRPSEDDTMLRAAVLAGEVKILGVPIEVLGL